LSDFISTLNQPGRKGGREGGREGGKDTYIELEHQIHAFKIVVPIVGLGGLGLLAFLQGGPPPLPPEVLEGLDTLGVVAEENLGRKGKREGGREGAREFISSTRNIRGFGHARGRSGRKPGEEGREGGREGGRVRIHQFHPKYSRVWTRSG